MTRIQPNDLVIQEAEEAKPAEAPAADAPATDAAAEPAATEEAKPVCALPLLQCLYLTQYTG